LLQLLTADSPYLDMSVGERAMIIKDNSGDWGIVVGSWKEYWKGVPGRKSMWYFLLAFVL
jgi:hypothetical protein